MGVISARLSPLLHRQSRQRSLPHDGHCHLCILSGHWSCAHINAVRGDGINPGLLGMRGSVSEDAVHLGIGRIDETDRCRVNAPIFLFRVQSRWGWGGGDGGVPGKAGTGLVMGGTGMSRLLWRVVAGLFVFGGGLGEGGWEVFGLGVFG